MPAPDEWIASLWPAVCARALRPVGGVLLDPATAGQAALGVFDEFLETFPDAPGSRETVQHWLTSRVAPRAIDAVSELRRRSGNWQACRDPERCYWEKNPDFDALRHRSADGSLESREWNTAAPVLRHRALPVLLRVGVAPDDAEDVVMECLAELTAPRTDAGPLGKMVVFEELPRFFGLMAERRGISWLRRVSAKKRLPMHPSLTERLDAPDNPLARTLTDPAGPLSPAAPPWANAGFERIRHACGAALTDFEWHLVEALFVEGTHTRLSLASDPWVLDQLGLTGTASESRRRRRLNLFVEEALSRLGGALKVCDL